MTPRDSILQDIVIDNGLVYALSVAKADRSSKASPQWMFTHSTLDGEVIQQHSLPHGPYLGLGVDGGTVWVHAMTYYDDNGVGKPNSILRVADGRIDFVTSVGMSVNGRFRHASPSNAFLTSGSFVALWNITESGPRNRGIVCALPFEAPLFFDLLTPGIAAITSGDGSRMTTVEIASGAFLDVPISSPEMGRAHAYAEPKRSASIAATGVGLDGLLYAMVFPSPRNAITIVKLDSTGKGAGSFSVQFPSRESGVLAVPLRLIVNNPDLGVVYGDGAVGWYQV